MTPEWGTAVGALPSETQFLLLDHGAASGNSASTNSTSNNSADGHSAAAAGPYSVLLPLLDGAFRGTLRAERNRCAVTCSLLSSRAWFAPPVLFAYDVPKQAARYSTPMPYVGAKLGALACLERQASAYCLPAALYSCVAGFGAAQQNNLTPLFLR
jgi:hypothetical protein